VGDRARADLGELAPHLLEAGGERARAVADCGDQRADRARKVADEPVELGLDRAGALEQLRGGLLDSLHVARGLHPCPLPGLAGLLVGAAPRLLRLALRLRADLGGALLGGVDDAAHLLGRRGGHGEGIAVPGGALTLLDPVGDLAEVVVDLHRIVPPSSRGEVRPRDEPTLELQSHSPHLQEDRRLG
jgi:hypothetical protein